MNLESIQPGRVEEIMLRHGAQSVALTDAGNDPVFEPAPGTTPLWRDTRMTAMFAADADFESLRTDLKQTLAIETLPDFGCGSGILSIAALKLGANILARVLAERAETICDRLRPGGGLALAGILAEQVPEVIAAYHHRIEFVPPDYRDNWARLSGTRT